LQGGYRFWDADIHGSDHGTRISTDFHGSDRGTRISTGFHRFGFCSRAGDFHRSLHEKQLPRIFTDHWPHAGSTGFIHRGAGALCPGRQPIVTADRELWSSEIHRELWTATRRWTV